MQVGLPSAGKQLHLGNQRENATVLISKYITHYTLEICIKDLQAALTYGDMHGVTYNSCFHHPVFDS